MPEDFRIRTMTRAEVESLACAWAAREGWNPGLADAGCFFAADPEGFLVGELAGLPVATLSAVRYGEGFGFMGFYIVAPEHRGRGHGRRLWDAGKARLAGRVVGLDAVLAQVETYRSDGFALAFHSARRMGESAGRAPLPPGVAELADVPFERIAAYERPLFPAGREAFLRCWLNMAGSRALGVVSEGRLRGYGVIRPCAEGSKIGPLFADGPNEAQTLFAALTGSLDAGERYFLDTPQANPQAVALADRHGLETVFTTGRMYLGPAPALDMARVFGITSFELG
jgi:GNAT superfamily N-acetyltransferase